MGVTQVNASLLGETQVLKNIGYDNYSGNLTAPIESGIYAVNVAAYDDVGNVRTATSYVDVTLWHTPKTNWNETDRFNFVDYNRIKNNLLYLHQYAESIYNSFEMPDMGKDITEYTSFWDVDMFNLFESNLELINKNIFTQDFGASQRFFENGAFIKWDELNRIESAILSMNNLLERQKNGLKRVSFRLGQFKRGFV